MKSDLGEKALKISDQSKMLSAFKIFEFMGMPYMLVIIPIAILLNIAMVIVGAISNDDPLCNV